MSVTLTPELEATIQERIESGRYPDAIEVVREALRLLEERDRLEHLRALIAEAEAEVARGEVVEWTPDLHARIFDRAIKDAKDGKQPDHHVVP